MPPPVLGLEKIPGRMFQWLIGPWLVYWCPRKHRVVLDPFQMGKLHGWNKWRVIRPPLKHPSWKDDHSTHVKSQLLPGVACEDISPVCYPRSYLLTLDLYTTHGSQQKGSPGEWQATKLGSSIWAVKKRTTWWHSIVHVGQNQLSVYKWLNCNPVSLSSPWRMGSDFQRVSLVPTNSLQPVNSKSPYKWRYKRVSLNPTYRGYILGFFFVIFYGSGSHGMKFTIKRTTIWVRIFFGTLFQAS